MAIVVGSRGSDQHFTGRIGELLLWIGAGGLRNVGELPAFGKDFSTITNAHQTSKNGRPNKTFSVEIPFPV